MSCFNLISSGRLLRQLALVTGLSVAFFALAVPEAYAATSKRAVSKTAKNSKTAKTAKTKAVKRTVRKSSLSSKRVATDSYTQLTLQTTVSREFTGGAVS